MAAKGMFKGFKGKVLCGGILREIAITKASTK
jgi:hypothetical protein